MRDVAALVSAAAMEEPPPPGRKECKSEDATCKISESDPEELSDEASADTFYGTSPPSTPRQMKRMSTKHQKNNVGRPASRSTLKASE